MNYPLNYPTLFLLVFLSFAVFPKSTEASSIIIEEPKEPNSTQILKAAELEKAPAKDLLHKLNSLLFKQSATALDTWLPFLRADENYAFQQAAMKTAPPGNKWHPIPDKDKTDKLRQAEEAKRLVCPVRLVDAILRKLEKMGTPDQIGSLLNTASRRSQTPWGRWKIYATVQGILTRCPAKDTLAQKELPVAVIISLLQDIPEKKAAALAELILDASIMNPKTQHVRWILDDRSKVLLAAEIVSTNPQRARNILIKALENNDPAIRLSAGLGLIRTGAPAPLLPFTTRVSLTSGEIQALHEPPLGEYGNAKRGSSGIRRSFLSHWAGMASDAKPVYQTALAPLSMPVLLDRTDYRRNMVWFDATGKIVRMIKDVDASIVSVFPDGTQVRKMLDETLSMTRSDGEVFSRFPHMLHKAVRAEDGGLWAIDQKLGSAQYRSDGTVHWAVPGRGVLPRQITPGNRGTFLQLDYQGIRLLNRRGDTLGVISKGKHNLEDPRYVALAPDGRLMIACTNTLIIIDPKGKAKPVSIGKFVSLTEIRTGSPTEPILLVDGGGNNFISLLNWKTLRLKKVYTGRMKP